MTRPTAIALRTASGPEIPAVARRSLWDSQELSSNPQLCRSPTQGAAELHLDSSVTQRLPSPRKPHSRLRSPTYARRTHDRIMTDT